MAKVFIFHGTGGHAEENWFPWLRAQLIKSGCEVIIPQFPTPENQTLEAWMAVFDKYRDQVDSDTIFVGHSLGGSFLLRALESLDQPIKASFLVGTPIGIQPIVNWAGDAPFTGHPFEWEKIRQNCQHFTVYHSDNDPYVGLKNGEELAKNLGVDLTFVKGAGHFNQKAGYLEFDDLLAKIKKEI